jgi:hypothetical protein
MTIYSIIIILIPNYDKIYWLLYRATHHTTTKNTFTFHGLLFLCEPFQLMKLYHAMTSSFCYSFKRFLGMLSDVCAQHLLSDPKHKCELNYLFICYNKMDDIAT